MGPARGNRGSRLEVRAPRGRLPAPRSGGFVFGSTIASGYREAADETSTMASRGRGVEKFPAPALPPVTPVGPRASGSPASRPRDGPAHLCSCGARLGCVSSVRRVTLRGSDASSGVVRGKDPEQEVGAFPQPDWEVVHTGSHI